MLQSRGTGSSRRSNACWTCKLRRKKCDVTHPACTACVSRTITCHGYDIERPQWMDGATREREELERIQVIVKENKRTQRKLQFRQKATQRQDDLLIQVHQSVGEEPSPGAAALLARHSHESRISSQAGPNPDYNDQDDEFIAEVVSSQHASSTNTPILHTAMAGGSVFTPETSSETPLSGSSPAHLRFSHHREAELLMHYLDQVFSLQFRFHVPSIGSGGRGWLLWLLTETKPLYHAALSLGALHRHSLLCKSERHDSLIDMNAHHTRALQEVQAFLHGEYDASNVPNRSRKKNLQVLACGVQFISFELFRGGINVWEPHLRYLAAALPQTYLDGKSEEGTRNGAHNAKGLEDTAEEFLTGSTLWFDIIACASTGQGPLMADRHHLLRSGRIDLANIIGCQSWIALLIGEIAQLQEDGRRHMLNTWELVERGSPIRKRLEHGLQVLRSEIDKASTTLGHTYIMLNATALAQAVHRAVTLVFACATQVYLNTSVTGAYPHSPEVRTSVADTAEALRDMRAVCDLQASRSLVWPICIAGCMAEDPALQTFFGDTIVDLGEEAHDFGNSITVLGIMKRCWSFWQEKRTAGAERQGYSWLTAMEETEQRVLLV